MRNLQLTLQEDTDAALLPTLAKVWKTSITGLDVAGSIPVIGAAMLDEAKAEAIWDALTDEQRGAMQMLTGSGGKMPKAMFTRVFGDFRKMGAAQIEREKPLERPTSIAEGLYYRGLIAEAFEQADTGPRVVIYVPDDLAQILPMRKTSYSNLKDEAPAQTTEEAPIVDAVDDVQHVQQADTSIVDDMTTLLAYLQLHSPLLDGETLALGDRAVARNFLLKPSDERIMFLFGVGVSADLIEVQAGKASPKRAEARRWLSASRATQVQNLAEGWRGSTLYRDLWHVAGLHPDPGGELDEYDAAVARDNVLELMGNLVPKQEWWSLESFIWAVKDSDPDFQRPGGDYDSWYIRNDEDEYLKGFESWDAVEGALLEFYISGPMHWLGLVDLGEDAARMTAYGRAFLGQTPWPNPPDPEDKITVKDDGTLMISRKVTRVDRFQAARFTTWVAAGDPYVYKLDATGIQRAGEQGINTGHIASFISRALGDAPVPAPITQLLENWRSGPAAAVTMEKLMVLRTTAPETLDQILDAPSLRRYLGARLGPMAVIVRTGQWEALRVALGEQGIQVEAME
ncbi:MAG: hypothetical protein K8I30_15790 [Anaerolineae bacterium]|nr:hypothetical protein [Anaerolineae bacterium]